MNIETGKHTPATYGCERERNKKRKRLTVRCWRRTGEEGWGRGEEGGGGGETKKKRRKREAECKKRWERGREGGGERGRGRERTFKMRKACER